MEIFYVTYGSKKIIRGPFRYQTRNKANTENPRNLQLNRFIFKSLLYI